MQVMDIIEGAQSGEAMANLARQFGVPEGDVRAVAQAVLPQLSRGIERNTLSRAGLADLVRALGDGHHEAMLESSRSWQDPRTLDDGQAILVNILGSERQVAALSTHAAQAAGLSESVVKMLLPILAQMLMGAIARYAKGGLGDILSKLPLPGGGRGESKTTSPDFETGGRMGDGRGFELPKAEVPVGGYPMPPMPDPEGGQPRSQQDARPTRPGGFDLPFPSQRSERPGGGFDLPGGGSPPAGGYPMPPIPRSPEEYGSRDAGDARDQGEASPFPFPLPTGNGRGNNPYGDLSDILRRGGQAPSNAAPGVGGLWSIVRNVLGGALGFRNRGILGWIVQFVVMRWGWKLLQRLIFRR